MHSTPAFAGRESSWPVFSSNNAELRGATPPRFASCTPRPVEIRPFAFSPADKNRRAFFSGLEKRKAVGSEAVPGRIDLTPYLWTDFEQAKRDDRMLTTWERKIRVCPHMDSRNGARNGNAAIATVTANRGIARPGRSGKTWPMQLPQGTTAPPEPIRGNWFP